MVLRERFLHIPFIMLIGLRAMAKAVPQIEALAKRIVFMDETVVGRERTRPQESLTTLQQRTADPTPDVGGPQVEPKEFRPRVVRPMWQNPMI